MAVNYKVYQSKRNDDTKGKFYAKVAHNETVNIKKIAQIMQANCTVKYSDILAVLTELSEVMKDEIQRGNKVKIDGLGTFKVGISTRAADSAKEFTAANITNTRVLFLPEGTVDATGKRVKSLLAGMKVKEADSYESLKDIKDTHDGE